VLSWALEQSINQSTTIIQRGLCFVGHMRHGEILNGGIFRQWGGPELSLKSEPTVETNGKKTKENGERQ
jgi:hypothetical protein